MSSTDHTIESQIQAVPQKAQRYGAVRGRALRSSQKPRSLLTSGTLLLLLLLFLVTPLVARAWFDCLWPYRTELTITENSGNTLNDYQVPIDLGAPDLHPAYAWSNGGVDLRVIDSDDLTELDFFIESWNAAAQTARVWVRFPTLNANSNRQIYFYYGNTSAPSSSTGFTFTNPGIRFHTRNTTTDPNSKAQAFSSFDAAGDGAPGYGCTFINNFTGINNRNQFSPPSQNSDFIALSESFFEVRSGEEGLWSFRYGADFGRGGGLYVNDIALEEQWTDDLWWANNWNASSEVLEGSTTLSAGYHKLEVIGGEGCCDGGITVQYRRPGGVFQTFTTSTIDVRSRECPVTDPSITFGTDETQAPNLSISKVVQVVEDPVNGTTNPKAIPGARVRYTISVQNLGEGTSDGESVVIEDAIPLNTRLYVQGTPPVIFSDGPVLSGLSFNYAGLTNGADDVAFSNDGGTNYSYQPVVGGDGTDASVTHLRITPTGRMSCGSSSPAPSFSTSFDILIE